MKLLKKAKLEVEIAEILKMTQPEYDRYIPVLLLVAALSNHSEYGQEFASYFIQ